MTGLLAWAHRLWCRHPVWWSRGFQGICETCSCAICGRVGKIYHPPEAAQDVKEAE